MLTSSCLTCQLFVEVYSWVCLYTVTSLQDMVTSATKWRETQLISLVWSSKSFFCFCFVFLHCIAEINKLFYFQILRFFLFFSFFFCTNMSFSLNTSPSFSLKCVHNRSLHFLNTFIATHSLSTVTLMSVVFTQI